jgi:hypothetical protein
VPPRQEAAKKPDSCCLPWPQALKRDRFRDPYMGLKAHASTEGPCFYSCAMIFCAMIFAFPQPLKPMP